MQLKETISGQKQREEWFSGYKEERFDWVRLRMKKPYAVDHPAPNWVGPSSAKVTYDKGLCKVLYMNDGAHGNVLNPEMTATMHNWLMVRYQPPRSRRGASALLVRVR